VHGQTLTVKINNGQNRTARPVIQSRTRRATFVVTRSSSWSARPARIVRMAYSEKPLDAPAEDSHRLRDRRKVRIGRLRPYAISVRQPSLTVG
jgi:hypothetical protein